MNSFALARREVRLHPTRFVALLAALMLAVGFLAATQVFTATEAHATRARAALWASRADVVVETHLYHATDARFDRDTALADAEDVLRHDPDVADVERFSELAAQVSTGAALSGVMLTSVATHPELRWYSVSAGRAPRTDREIMLSAATARQLHVGIGDVVHLDVVRGAALSVVGLTDQQGWQTPPAYVTMGLLLDADRQFPPPNYQIVVDPRANLARTPYSSGDGIGVVLLVRASDPGSAGTLVERLRREFLQRVILHADPVTAAEVQREAVTATSGGTVWLGSLITGAAAMSLVVGAMTVATSFGILAAQRRRRIGLLRAVGATRAQIARWFLAEALLLGVAGALIGTPAGVGGAALVSWFGTGSLGYGVVVPWARLAVIAGFGVVAALVAAIVPAVEATRVSPLEALASAAGPAASGRRRARPALAVAALVVLGAASLVAALRAGPSWPVGSPLIVVAAGAALAGIGVLAGAPLGVGPLLRALAHLARHRPVPALAASTAARNPTRSGATVAVLLLACGLIVTVQVTAATGTRAAVTRIDERYPADVSLQAAIQEPEPVDMAFGSSPISNRDAHGMLVGFTPDALALVRGTPGVAAAGEFLTSEPLTIIAGLQLTVVFPAMALTPEVEPLLHHPVSLTDGEVGLSSAMIRDLRVRPGAVVQLQPLIGDEIALRVIEVNIGSTLAVVTPATMARLGVHTKPGLIIARLDRTSPSASVLDALSARLIPGNSGLSVSGSVQQQATLHRVVDGASRILLGLLGVVVVVAMLGVANTLALSVIERTRESALLRALGLGRGSLRAMLLVEAWMLGAIAVVVGLALGIVVGWAGAAVVVRQAGLGMPAVVVPWPAVGSAVLGVLVAAGAASVLPGRVAARSTPVTALRDLG